MHYANIIHWLYGFYADIIYILWIYFRVCFVRGSLKRLEEMKGNVLRATEHKLGFVWLIKSPPFRTRILRDVM